MELLHRIEGRPDVHRRHHGPHQPVDVRERRSTEKSIGFAGLEDPLERLELAQQGGVGSDNSRAGPTRHHE